MPDLANSSRHACAYKCANSLPARAARASSLSPALLSERNSVRSAGGIGSEVWATSCGEADWGNAASTASTPSVLVPDMSPI